MTDFRFDLAEQLDDFSRRIHELEVRGAGQVAVAQLQHEMQATEARVSALEASQPRPPDPGGPGETLRLLDIAVGGGVYQTSTNIAAGLFNVPRPGRIVWEGQLDVRMDYWVNNEGFNVGTRRIYTNVVAGIGESARHMVGGSGSITREVVGRRDEAAIGAGQFQSAWVCQVAGGNVLRVYGGWLWVTWTG